MRWALALVVLLGVGGPPPADAADRLRVAVFEYADRTTGNTGTSGAKLLLEKAGAQVEYLDITRSPLEQKADVIVFGSWVDVVRNWRAWVSRHKRDLQAFIAAGGLLVEMTQSDDRWAVPRWLPDGFFVRRTDRDVNTIRLVGKRRHPLLGWAPTRKDKDELFLDLKPAGRDSLSWEGLQATEGVEVLLAEDAERTRPQMVLGAYGKGRFLVTSLHLDKLYLRDGALRPDKKYESAARDFFRALVRYGDQLRKGKARPVVASVQAPVGPVLGHVDAHRAFVWYRPSTSGTCELHVQSTDGGPVIRLTAESLTARDRTVTWQVGGLQPQTEYVYTIRRGDAVLAEDILRTAPAPDTAARVRIAFGACPDSTDHPVWARMPAVGADAIVLLGDAPRIDTTRLSTARSKHRAFLHMPTLAEVVRRVPLWSTWDDSDMGRNDADGTLRGKEGTRQAYVEYRAQARYGHDGQGIYSKVRYGPVEVFLLDTRWFAATAPSPAEPTAPTCLGRVQWSWLREGLRTSTAAFKVLACGIVWHDKGTKSEDDWATYAVERDALFAYIGKAKIPGVVLVGGDVHVSQHLVHPPTAGAGYPLHEMIASPLHERPYPAHDTKHAAKVWSAGEKHVFLLLDVNTKASVPYLGARWIREDGKVLRKVRLRPKDLRAP